MSFESTMSSTRKRLAGKTLVTTSLFLMAACLAGASASAQSAPSAPTRDQRALKVLEAARDLVAAGRADESIPFYGHALDLAEAEEDEPSVALANLLAEYGDVLRAAGLRERARVSLERSLAMLEGLVDADGDVGDDPRLATALLALGRLDADESRCAEAEDKLTRGLQLADAEDAKRRVPARVALGHCEETGTSRPDQNAAFEHYRAAVLEAREASLETPEVATAMHRGAAILLARGETGPAINFFEQSLKLRRQVLGTSHWQTADTAHQLALALDQQGQRGAARRTAAAAVEGLGRACAPTSQSPAEVRELCRDLALLRRRLADEPPQVARQPEPRPDPEPPRSQPQTRFRAQTEERAASDPQTADPADRVWRVQVSSHRSPAEAERVAEMIRNRFPALLRSQELTLERAELASGVWHRVLFGSFPARAGAVALCESLRRAGLEACLPSPSG